ncbi:hypothetical protein BST97_03160 [Nonlabens spongiae]|uniref:Uncharacterized protein n=1 Tax=Nonlabens spongiae TaxID=331648 RepID=A0A1W6MHM4_9FLAO|nr:hypothetical protein BST97_03160 [Nonlabens spongiae]
MINIGRQLIAIQEIINVPIRGFLTRSRETSKNDLIISFIGSFEVFYNLFFHHKNNIFRKLYPEQSNI